MAKKARTVYVCQNCGAESLRWQGKCQECGEWNTFQAMTVAPPVPAGGKRNWVQTPHSGKPLLLNEHQAPEEIRVTSKIQELDRVLGGGITEGSLILFGGEPGIGKSTLLLQVAINLANQYEILYVSGEESFNQIKMRANRIGAQSEPIKLLIEAQLEVILQTIESENAQFVIIDSIQTTYSEHLDAAPGSVSQIKHCAAQLLRMAKSRRITIFLVGHITKEGAIAGPKVLEHMVDTVLYFEGDRLAAYRIIRAVKNRFGAIGEVGIFQMQNDGLCEMTDPTFVFMPHLPQNKPGICLSVSLEGTRAFLMEIQALATPINFGYPQRVANGIDNKRLAMLLAILEKHLRLTVYSHDIFINLTGGLQVREPGIDLSVAMAIYSSICNRAIPPKTAWLGELGLTGEIRPVSQLEIRLKEIEKFGMEQCFLPAGIKLHYKPDRLKLISIGDINEAINYIN